MSQCLKMHHQLLTVGNILKNFLEVIFQVFLMDCTKFSFDTKNIVC